MVLVNAWNHRCAIPRKQFSIRAAVGSKGSVSKVVAVSALSNALAVTKAIATPPVVGGFIAGGLHAITGNQCCYSSSL